MTPICKAKNGTEKRALQWLARNRSAIASYTGYPAEFHRQILFSLVEPGSKVAWLQRIRNAGEETTLQTGRVSILTRGSHAAVLVTGSSGASPAIVDVRNIVWCDKAPPKL